MKMNDIQKLKFKIKIKLRMPKTNQINHHNIRTYVGAHIELYHHIRLRLKSHHYS